MSVETGPFHPGTDVLTKASSGGQDWFYCYSSSGDLTRIARPACDQSDQGDPSADYYNYDAFDRLLSAKGPDNQPGAGSDPHGYQYDGLDRPYSECVGNSTTTSFQDVQDKACPDGHTRTDSYVGMSPLLSQEQDQAAGTTQSFDYDSSFNQIGQQTDGGSQAGYLSYAQSADGSVEGLIGDSGQSTGSYFYDPYGELQKPDGSLPDAPAPGGDPNTAEAALSDSARANPFRFQGFSEDSGVKTYDMQARQYRPDVGRFLTADTYESSLGQSNLESDPLTQDSYAFAGGNPVNNIEFDGHGGAGAGPNGVYAPSYPLPGSPKTAYKHASKAQGQQAQEGAKALHEAQPGGSQYEANQRSASALSQEDRLSNYHVKPIDPFPCPDPVSQQKFDCGQFKASGLAKTIDDQLGDPTNWSMLIPGFGEGGITAKAAKVCEETCEKAAGLISKLLGRGGKAAEAPRFTQTSVSAAFRHGRFEGQRISDVAAGLRSGAISPSQLPVDVIRRDGALYALNNRSTLTLRRGGIDPARWTLRDVTGNPALERKLSQRLADDGIPEGSHVIRVRGAGPNASAYR